MTVPSLPFSTTEVVRRERGDLREVGDDDDLRGCRPGAPGGGRSRSPLAPPTPASTSSKTNVGTGSLPAITTSIASITRESSPPDAPLPDRPRLGAGVRLQQDRDLVAAGRAELALGHRDRRRVRRASRARAARRSRRRTERLRRRPVRAVSRIASSSTCARPASTSAVSSVIRSSSSSSSIEARAAGVELVDRGVERAAVLAGERGQLGAALLHGLELAAAVGVERSEVAGELRGQVGEGEGCRVEPPRGSA